jgi:hypothetical protein
MMMHQLDLVQIMLYSGEQIQFNLFDITRVGAPIVFNCYIQKWVQG